MHIAKQYKPVAQLRNREVLRSGIETSVTHANIGIRNAPIAIIADSLTYFE